MSLVGLVHYCRRAMLHYSWSFFGQNLCSLDSRRDLSVAISWVGSQTLRAQKFKIIWQINVIFGLSSLFCLAWSFLLLSLPVSTLSCGKSASTFLFGRSPYPDHDSNLSRAGIPWSLVRIPSWFPFGLNHVHDWGPIHLHRRSEPHCSLFTCMSQWDLETGAGGWVFSQLPSWSPAQISSIPLVFVILIGLSFRFSKIQKKWFRMQLKCQWLSVYYDKSILCSTSLVGLVHYCCRAMLLFS